jgi:apoptosis-inducing factor 3
LAERHGQTAARNILGAGEPFDGVPFFWSQHYDQSINYVGYAERWDRIDIEGNLETKDCALRFVRGDKVLAVATLGRDRESLEAELAMEAVSGKR